MRQMFVISKREFGWQFFVVFEILIEAYFIRMIYRMFSPILLVLEPLKLWCEHNVPVKTYHRHMAQTCLLLSSYYFTCPMLPTLNVREGSSAHNHVYTPAFLPQSEVGWWWRGSCWVFLLTPHPHWFCSFSLITFISSVTLENVKVCYDKLTAQLLTLYSLPSDQDEASRIN